MRGIARLLLLVVLAALAAGAWYARGAIQVAVGYSAKQFCSGVFVAGLSEDFVLQRDIRPRMAILGPLLPSLEISADRRAGTTRARLLGVGARAVHRAEEGCVLHSDDVGVAPVDPSPVAADLAVHPGLADAVAAAFAEPEGGGRNTLALLVARGPVLVERYAPPVTAGTRMQGWSMNKSLMATWVGLQAAAGRLDPTWSLRSLLPDEPLITAMDGRLTLLHLLQMESGLDFDEVYGPGSDVTRMLYVEPAMWKVPATVPQTYAPGQHFSYSSGDTVLASLFWQRSLDQPYMDWINEQFVAPLGLSSRPVFEADASGIQVGSSYAYLSPRDWLAVGRLWLDAWHGRSALLSQDWLRASVTPRASDARGRYGRGFWLNTGGVAFPGLPDSLFYAGGNAGQYVVVIPEWELVVVRLGLTEPSVDSGLHAFLRELAALRDSLPAVEVAASPAIEGSAPQSQEVGP